MTQLTIEKARAKDIDALVRLEKICFETDRLSASQFKYFIKKSSALVIVAKQNDSVIGDAVILFRKNSRITRLYSIAVDTPLRRQGIAQSLYEFIERNLMSRKCNEMRLEVRKTNDSAIHFYRKNGYETFGEYHKFYEDGADAIRMRKILSF